MLSWILVTYSPCWAHIRGGAHALCKPMGGLSFLNGDGREVGREGVNGKEERKRGEEGEETDWYIR